MMQGRITESPSVGTKAILAALGVGVLGILAYTQVPSFRRLVKGLVTSTSSQAEPSATSKLSEPLDESLVREEAELDKLRMMISDIDHVLVPFNLSSEIDNLLKLKTTMSPNIGQVIEELRLAKDNHHETIFATHRVELWEALKEHLRDNGNNEVAGVRTKQFLATSLQQIHQFLNKHADNKFVVAGKYAVIIKSVLLDDSLGFEMSSHDRDQMVRQRMLFVSASNNPANRVNQIKGLVEKASVPVGYQYDTGQQVWTKLKAYDLKDLVGFPISGQTYISTTSEAPEETPYPSRNTATYPISATPAVRARGGK